MTANGDDKASKVVLSVSSIDIEFDQLWDRVNSLEEEDLEAMHRESERCFGPSSPLAENGKELKPDL